MNAMSARAKSPDAGRTNVSLRRVSELRIDDGSERSERP